jgi:hypothetical protein
MIDEKELDNKISQIDIEQDGRQAYDDDIPGRYDSGQKRKPKPFDFTTKYH